MRNRPDGFEIYIVNVKTIRTIFVAFLEKLNFISLCIQMVFNRQFSKENIHTSGYKSGSSSIFRLAVVSLWQKSTIRWHSSAAV